MSFPPSRTTRRRSFSLPFLGALLTLVACPTAMHAAVQTWDGLGADNNWSTAANWISGTAPVAADSVVFVGATGLNPNNDTLSSIAGITFGSGAAFTLSGGSLALGAGGVVNGNTIFSQTVGLNLTLATTRVFSGAGTTLVTGTLSGAGGVASSGPVTLSSLNTYTGLTKIDGGTLTVTNIANGGAASSLGASSSAASSLIIGTSNQSVFRYTGTGGSTDRLFTLGRYGATFDSSGSGAIQFVNSGTISYDANISFARNINLRGSNTGNNVFAPTLYDPSTGANILSLIKYDSGNWTVSGSNAYTGETQIYDGTLKLDFSAANAPSSNILYNGSGPTIGTLRMRGGVLAVKGNAIGTTTQTIGQLRYESGDLKITVDANGGAGTTLAFNTLSRTGGVLDVTLNSGAALTFGTVSLQNGILPYMTVNGADFATVNSGSVMAFAGYTTLSGASPTLTSGTAQTIKIDNSSSGDIGQGTGTTQLNAILASDSSARQITIGTGKALNLGSVGAIMTTAGAGDLTIGASGNAGTLLAGGATTNASGELLFIANSTSGITVNSVISQHGSGNVSVTKSGIGTLTLNGTNTYKGVTNVNGGVLSISSNANLGDVATGTTLLINGGTIRATSTFALDNGGANSRVVSLQSGGGTFDVTSGNQLTISGVISQGQTGNRSGLTKIGSGTLALSGTNTYTGATVINAGTLLVASTGITAAASSFTVNNTGVLGGSGTINGTVTVNSGGAISPGSGAPDTIHVGTTILNGGGSYLLELNSQGTGSAGTNWDSIAIAGGLDISGLGGGSQFTISLTTLTGANASGPLDTWDAGSDHTWASILTTTGGFSGMFDPADFTVNASGFQNTISGSFSVVANGSNLDLVYTAVPEPGTVVLLSLGAGALLWRLRRRSV